MYPHYVKNSVNESDGCIKYLHNTLRYLKSFVMGVGLRNIKVLSKFVIILCWLRLGLSQAELTRAFLKKLLNKKGFTGT